MKRHYYDTPQSTTIMRLFWKAAGADRFILERATYSDQVKYMCLGGIIVATGVMAAIAGGYAFYTIFAPKGSSLDPDEGNLSVTLCSMLFGIIWGAMIFNLDRFIVSSTGKGDGTEAITWSELKSAFPRIVMGAIIAVTISKPVEIRMFKSEIDTELRNVQMETEREYLSRIEKNYAGRIEDEKKKIEKWEGEIKIKDKRHEELVDLYHNEMGGRNGGDWGDGPQSEKIMLQMEEAKHDLEELKKRNEPMINESLANLKKYQSEKQKEISNAETAANNLDGLLERIKLAHKLSGPYISWFITLLFMAIELTPIFFKLMLTKTPYDYIEENIKELMKAEEGILIEYNYYKDRKGQERDLVIHYAKEKLSTERMALLRAQQEITKHAIDKYTQEMKQKIDANPGEYIKLETEQKHEA